jgi:hypothetical protein
VAGLPVDDSEEEPGVYIIELGGTVGDIESAHFIEALVQLRHRLGRDNFFSIAVSYVPIINGEEKTKPTQHATKQMRSAGLIPDIIACHFCSRKKAYSRYCKRGSPSTSPSSRQAWSRRADCCGTCGSAPSSRTATSSATCSRMT